MVKNPKKSGHVVLGAFIWNHPTPRKDCKIDRDKVLGTDLRFLEKSRKWAKKMKKEEKIKKYTLKKEPLGNYLTFRNKPVKVLYSRKEPKKEPVEVLYPQKRNQGRNL